MIEKLEGVHLSTMADYFYRIIEPRLKISGTYITPPEHYNNRHILEFFRLMYVNFPASFIDPEQSIGFDENGTFLYSRIKKMEFSFLNKRLCDIDWVSFMEMVDRSVMTVRNLGVSMRFVTEQGASMTSLNEAIRIAKNSPQLRIAGNTLGFAEVSNTVRDHSGYNYSVYRRESCYLNEEYRIEKMSPKLKAYYWSDDIDAASTFGINHHSRYVDNSANSPLLEPSDPMAYYSDNENFIKSRVMLVCDFSSELEFFEDSSF